MPPAGQQLRGQFQAQAAIGPGHQAVLAVHVRLHAGVGGIGTAAPMPSVMPCGL